MTVAPRLWDVATALPLGPPLRHRAPCNPVESVALSPDGQTALSISQDGVSRLWRIAPPACGEPHRLTEVASWLTQQKFDAGLYVRALDPDERSHLSVAPGAPELTALAGRTAEDERRWHLQAADESELRNEHFATLWHLDRLIASRPDDAWMLTRAPPDPRFAQPLEPGTGGLFRRHRAGTRSH